MQVFVCVCAVGRGVYMYIYIYYNTFIYIYICVEPSLDSEGAFWLSLHILTVPQSLTFANRISSALM